MANFNGIPCFNFDVFLSLTIRYPDASNNGTNKKSPHGFGSPLPKQNEQSHELNSGPNPDTGCNQIIPHAEMINIAFVGEAVPVK